MIFLRESCFLILCWVGGILQTSPNFDPVKGCQSLSTGVLGGFFILVLVTCYAFYLQNIPNGGPKIPEIHSWLPGDFRFKGLNRTYVDVMLMMMTGFGFMVTWEFVCHRALKVLTLMGAALGVGVLVGITVKSPTLGRGLALFGVFWTWFDWGLFTICLFWLVPWILTGLFGHQKLFFSSWRWALKTAFWRWFAGWILFVGVMLVMFYHPFYRNAYYENWRISCGFLFGLYTFCGLPYAFVTNWLRGHKAENRSDPGFVLLLLGRSVIQSFFKRSKWRVGHQLRNRRVGIVLRDLLVKLFWVPLMISFLFIESGNFFNFIAQWAKTGVGDSTLKMRFDLFYFTAYRALFVMDVSLGLIGYVASSRWLGNKSKSVEPTLFGWVVALMCYPPFNTVTEGYLPYHANFGTPFVFWGAEWIDVVFKFITLAMFSVYVWATMAFGLRFSNVTHRGIITRGPYAYIRHPAYFAKNLAWWMESIRSFASPWQFLFLGLWNLIYYLRAITEERHLRQDPDYGVYAERVRGRFFPKFQTKKSPSKRGLF